MKKIIDKESFLYLMKFRLVSTMICYSTGIDEHCSGCINTTDGGCPIDRTFMVGKLR